MAMERESAYADDGLDGESARSFFDDPASWFTEVRRRTTMLCEPLQTEDYLLQSAPDCSPAKWHLAHTTWFFERFVLQDAVSGFEPFHPDFGFLFNSYYETVGKMHPRNQRGLLSRPTVREVYAYREATDAAMLDALQSGRLPSAKLRDVHLGLHHEQQHQELLLTDIKHGFSCNPILPAYRGRAYEPAESGCTKSRA